MARVRNPMKPTGKPEADMEVLYRWLLQLVDEVSRLEEQIKELKGE